MTDPPRRPDNKCANPQCGKPAPGKPARLQTGLNPAMYEREPFCSTECAKAWHGVSIPRGPVLTATTEEKQ